MSSSSSFCPLKVTQSELLSNETIQQLQQVQSGQFSQSSQSGDLDFYKQLKFSPDGLMILASTENNILKTWKMNTNLINNTKYYCQSNEQQIENNSLSYVDTATATQCKDIKCGESIYDIDWYPYSTTSSNSNSTENSPENNTENSNNSNNLFLTSCRDHPIHLWDADRGNVRCTYTCYNMMDEVEAANCVTFNLTGDKIYAGSNRMIRTFDVNNPGTNINRKYYFSQNTKCFQNEYDGLCSQSKRFIFMRIILFFFKWRKIECATY